MAPPPLKPYERPINIMNMPSMKTMDDLFQGSFHTLVTPQIAPAIVPKINPAKTSTGPCKMVHAMFP